MVKKHPRKLTNGIGKSPFSIGNTSSFMVEVPASHVSFRGGNGDESHGNKIKINYLMVYFCWWFGILGVHPSFPIPFIKGFQESKPPTQTNNQPVALKKNHPKKKHIEDKGKKKTSVSCCIPSGASSLTSTFLSSIFS